MKISMLLLYNFILSGTSGVPNYYLEKKCHGDSRRVSYN